MKLIKLKQKVKILIYLNAIRFIKILITHDILGLNIVIIFKTIIYE